MQSAPTLLTQKDLEDAMSPATVSAIFDDAGAADGSINVAALSSVLIRAETQVYSYVARNYPNLTIPVTSDSPPETLRSAAIEFAIVYARDRKSEYWAKAQEGERAARIKGAFEMAERYAKAEQILFDSGATPPANVGGFVGNADPSADDEEPKPRLFEDTGIF